MDVFYFIIFFDFCNYSFVRIVTLFSLAYTANFLR